MLNREPLFRTMGDRALLVELGDTIAPGINQRVEALFQTLKNHPLEGVRDLVPCYRSVMITYDPLTVDVNNLKTWITGLQHGEESVTVKGHRTLRVPVVYGGDHGPDLEWVARYHNITQQEVVQLHTSRMYRVYMIGFTPGHPYLGELPDGLATPRKETPRPVVPRGSVGIARNQIVIYPAESPGGFQIIGRTPLILFDPEKKPPALFRMGDQVEFYPVTEKEMENWVL